MIFCKLEKAENSIWNY